MLRNLRETSLPSTIATGVNRSSAQARRASNQRISRNAPTSWSPVTSICGKVSMAVVETDSMSFESLEATSPEWSLPPP